MSIACYHHLTLTSHSAFAKCPGQGPHHERTQFRVSHTALSRQSLQSFSPEQRHRLSLSLIMLTIFKITSQSFHRLSLNWIFLLFPNAGVQATHLWEERLRRTLGAAHCTLWGGTLFWSVRLLTVFATHFVRRRLPVFIVKSLSPPLKLMNTLVWTV